MNIEVPSNFFGENSQSEFLDSLKSKYLCLHQPLPAATPGDRRYLPSLWVFGRREVDGPDSPLPQSFSNLMVDHNIIDTHIVTERITSALKVLKFRRQRVLVQFWSPVAVRKRWLLTTWDQPFGLCEADEWLCSYRIKSEQLAVVVNPENVELDRRARVYSQKLPEWSLDVHAGGDACDNIHGYIDLPVFEYSGGGFCVGVLEIITSSDYVDYAFEVEEVSNALKEQNLKSPNVFEDPRFCIADERRQYEVDQIFKALKTLCDIQNLPLAQTWALSGCSSYVGSSGNLEPSCGSFNRRCIHKVCMSTANLPFYVRDLSMWEFHEACTEQHLEISQGVVGRSFSSRGTWFCGDVAKLDEDDYPLFPIARMSGITSCLAIYLKNLEADVEYVIEIFLPARRGNKAGVQRLMETVKQQINNASWLQIDILSAPQVIGGVPLNWELESPRFPIISLTESGEVPHELENYVEEDHMENEPSNSMDTSKSVVPYLEKRVKDVDISNPGGTRRNQSDISKVTSRKTKRSERSIDLEEIRKHYGKTMDEAATILNVSRSTLKRICRNLGIPRWPYKIGGHDKGDDPDIKFDQTVVAVNAPQGAPSLVFPASNKPLGTTNTTNDPAPLIPHVLPQQEQPNLPGERTKSEIASRGRLIETKAPKTMELVIIKATYGDNTIRFQFNLLDGLVKLEKLVATRFALSLGSFSLKYKDEDDDIILVACDSDLKLIHGAFGQSGTVIKLFVQLATH